MTKRRAEKLSRAKNNNDSKKITNFDKLNTQFPPKQKELSY